MKKESQPAAGVCSSFLGGTKREHRGLAVVALFAHFWYIVSIIGISISSNSISNSNSIYTSRTERATGPTRPFTTQNTYSQASKKEKRKKKNHDLDNQRIPIPRPAIPMASNHHHNPHLHHIHASRRLPPLLDPKKNSPQRGLAHVRHDAV